MEFFWITKPSSKYRRAKAQSQQNVAVLTCKWVIRHFNDFKLRWYKAGLSSQRCRKRQSKSSANNDVINDFMTKNLISIDYCSYQFAKVILTVACCLWYVMCKKTV